MVVERHPIQGLHDNTSKDFRAMPPEQLMAKKARDDSRRPVTAFQLETGQRANPYDHEKDPSLLPPAKQPGAEPKTAFELEMMGGRKKAEAPLDVPASAAPSRPPETDDERIARLQKELEMAEVAKMEKEKPVGLSSPRQEPETPASAAKASSSTQPQAPSKPNKLPNKPNENPQRPS